MMQTQSEIRVSETKRRKIANRLELSGWITFGAQIALAIASVVALGLMVSNPELNQSTTPGIAIGVFWAICGIITLFGGIYLALSLALLARKVRLPNLNKQPQRAEILKLLRAGIIVGLVGMLIMILGEGTTLVALLAKAIAQPKPGAIYDANQLIRPLDILASLSNMSGTAAHFVGAVVPLWLVNWLQRQ